MNPSAAFLLSVHPPNLSLVKSFPLQRACAHTFSFLLRYNPSFGNWGPKSMKATYHPGIHRYALFVVCWTVVLLTAGALVTSEDAALAVPDWPLSYGTLNPPMIGGIAFEHSHRMIAAALGFLVIILAFLLWRKDERPGVRWLGAFAVLGVCLQGGLGGLTVLKLLRYWLPVMHACTAEIVFALLVSIAVSPAAGGWRISRNTRTAALRRFTASSRSTPLSFSRRYLPAPAFATNTFL